ncbi:MAG: type II toxin-antitoxin system HicB family antitoxin [Methyloceanibacter sp.]|uniref:type II toxin-antitoxin system HicB family antitoxin n=1 Tax=Methyloceanibacter sp. TaxID=1965321 RepID=UPI003D6D850D
MSVLNHKGYQGSAEYEDGYLVLKILHIDDSISTHVTNTSKAQEAFAELVDDYLETCRELGKEPARPCKGSFNVRVGPDLHKAALHAAARRNQSLNAWVCDAISRQLANDLSDARRDREWLESLRQGAVVTAGVFGREPLEPIQLARTSFGQLRSSPMTHVVWHAKRETRRLV